MNGNQNILTCFTDFDVYKYALSGGFAGGCRALSRGLTFPFDTLKTFAQSDQSLRPAKIDYYRGMWISVISAIPANAMFFVIYYDLEHLWSCLLQFHQNTAGLSVYQPDNFMIRLLISAIATIPQNFVKVPAELLKQRAQVTPDIPLLLLTQQILQRDGVSGLFRGTSAQLLRELPYNALQMVFFAWLRAHWSGIEAWLASTNWFASGPTSDILQDTRYVSGLLGLLACAMAALLTQPADVLKTRLMTDPDDLRRVSDSNNNNDKVNNSTSHSSSYGLQAAVEDIYRKHGWRGFFAGLSSRLAIVSVGGMIYFAAASLIITDL